MASQQPKPPPPPRPKTRGNYNCGRCGQPKKGHVCVAPVPIAVPSGGGGGGGAPSPSPSTSSGAASASGDHRLRRALSFDEAGTPSSPEKKPKVVLEGDVDMDAAAAEGETGDGGDEDDDDAAVEVGGRPVPGEVMAEVLRRLGPRGVMAAAGVSRGWRDCAGRVWRAADELRLRVLPGTGAGLLGALLPRCPALSRLDLRMER
jgi:hypothetical protein